MHFMEEVEHSKVERKIFLTNEIFRSTRNFASQWRNTIIIELI